MKLKKAAAALAAVAVMASAAALPQTAQMFGSPTTAPVLGSKVA